MSNPSDPGQRVQMVPPFLGLLHSTAGQVVAGRIDSEDARRALERTVARVFGGVST